MIEVTQEIRIDEAELQFAYVQASGPGGQNVNKVASAVQLRFDVSGSPSLPEEVKNRLRRLAGSRISSEGVLLIEARRYRSQQQNRQDAIERLVGLIARSAQAPKRRKATRPSAAARERRLEVKRRRSEVKRRRRGEGEA